MTTLINILGATMSIGFIACYFPQVYKMFRTKSVDDVSILMYYIAVACFIIGFTYFVLTNTLTFWLAVSYFGNFTQSVIIIILYHKHKIKA